MKEIYMEARLNLSASSALIRDDIAGISVGGHCFLIDGKYVPFDFEGFSINIWEDDVGKFLHVYTSESGFFKNTDIDTDTYRKDYERLGLTAQDITAEFLSSATEIAEFTCEVELTDGSDASDLFSLVSVTFFDESSRKYEVEPAVIEKHRRLKKQ